MLLLERFASLRWMRSPNEEGRVLSTVPGHYIDPVISPDGTKVVFERIGGGWLTSPLWSRDQGIFLVSTDGSQAPQRVTRSGHRPQFGKNSDRVFLQRTRTEPEADHRELFSVDLEGNDERLHVTSDWATEYSISGNGHWLAFIERFHVYVLPLVSTGDVVHLSPDQKALPMLRATEEAGQWIHFGSKSDTLHWTLGDRFYSLPISMEALSDPKDTARPQASATHIGMEIPHDQPTGMIALRNARVLSMTSFGSGTSNHLDRREPHHRHGGDRFAGNSRGDSHHGSEGSYGHAWID